MVDDWCVAERRKAPTLVESVRTTIPIIIPSSEIFLSSAKSCIHPSFRQKKVLFVYILQVKHFLAAVLLSFLFQEWQ